MDNSVAVINTVKQSRSDKWYGMNWISQERRLALYIRDGLACAYCGATLEEGKLSLDHYLPVSEGGKHNNDNLVTCCVKCNSAKKNRKALEFIVATAMYLNVDANAILTHVNICRRAPIHLNVAKELISRRGSCFAVLHSDELH